MANDKIMRNLSKIAMDNKHQIVASDPRHEEQDARHEDDTWIS